MLESNGFSVLELLIGMMLLGLIAAGIAPVLLLGMSTASASEELTTLTVESNARLEALVALPFDSAELAAGGSLTSSETDYSEDPLDGDDTRFVRWEITDESALMKRIRVIAGTRRTMTGLTREIEVATFKVDMQ